MPATEEERPKEEADPSSYHDALNQALSLEQTSDDTFAEPYQDEDEEEQQEFIVQDELPAFSRTLEDDACDDVALQQSASNQQDVKVARGPKVWSSVLYRFLVNRKIDGDFLIDREHIE